MPYFKKHGCVQYFMNSQQTFLLNRSKPLKKQTAYKQQFCNHNVFYIHDHFYNTIIYMQPTRIWYTIFAEGKKNYKMFSLSEMFHKNTTLFYHANFKSFTKVLWHKMRAPGSNVLQILKISLAMSFHVNFNMLP